MERMALRLIDWLKRSDTNERNIEDFESEVPRSRSFMIVSPKMMKGKQQQLLSTRILESVRRNFSQTPKASSVLTSVSNPGPLTFIVIVPNWDNGSEECHYLNLLIKETRKLHYLSAIIYAEQFHHRYTSYQTCQGLIEKVRYNSQKEKIESILTIRNTITESTVDDNCVPERSFYSVIPCFQIFTVGNKVLSTHQDSISPRHTCYQQGNLRDDEQSRVNCISDEAREETPRSVFYTCRRSLGGSDFDSISPSLMIILQNKEGRAKWPVTEKMLQNISNAWK